jgi:hypothetical protein
MPFAQNSRSSLSYVTEVTFGTTPVGNFLNLPFSTHSLNMTKDRVSGNDIQPDRMLRVDRHGNRQVTGDVVVDLRDAVYDAFLESAMMSTWVTDVIKIGTTPKFFSIEDYAADIDQARVFTGCTVSSMAVSLAPNQMVTTTFTIVGKDMSVSALQKTQTASATTAPFDSYSGDISIGNVGSPAAIAIVTGLDFTLNNSFAPTFVIGDATAPSLEYGRAEIEGTLTAYFEDAALLNRFVNETETALVVSVGDPSGNTLTFNFPKIKINTADIPVDGPTGSRVISMSFIALFDTTTSSNLVITRA